MLAELKTISLFISSAISSFSFYFHPYFTIIGITLMVIAVIGLLILLILNLKKKNAEKKLINFKMETEDILEEVIKNREKIEEE